MKQRDPREVVTVIRRSIEGSSKRSRRVRLHRFRELFGFQAWSSQRKELVSRLMDEQGILAQPSLFDASSDAWISLTLPELPPERHDHRDPKPSAEWFEHLRTVQLDSEREVEIHFASPLFRALGYEEEQEAAGFHVDSWDGGRKHRIEADLIYFADHHHSVKGDGQPLVLVECKSPSQDRALGAGQARSYSYWVMPAYYVVTNGRYLSIYNYQGGRAPDVLAIELESGDLEARFDDLYSIVGYKAALEARHLKQSLLSLPAPLR